MSVEILKFSSDMCQPCKQMQAHLEKHKLDVTNVDVEENWELAKKYNVRGVPTLVALKDGKEMDRVVGFSNNVIDKIERLFNV